MHCELVCERKREHNSKPMKAGKGGARISYFMTAANWINMLREIHCGADNMQHGGKTFSELCCYDDMLN